MDYFFLKQTTADYEQKVKELSTELLKTADRLKKKIESSNGLGDLKSLSESIDKIKSRIESQGTFLRENRAKIAEEIGRTDRQIQKIVDKLKTSLSSDEERELRTEMNGLFRTRSKLSELQRMNDSAIFNLNHTNEEILKLSSGIEDKAQKIRARQPVQKRHLLARSGKRLAASGIRIVKSANGKFNPLEKKINKASTSDHGVESLRLANQVYKQGKSTVKTTVRTAKSAIAAPKKAMQFTRLTLNVALSVVSHTFAVLFSPVLLIAAVILVIVLICMAVIVIAAGGEDSSEKTTTMLGAYMSMVGIDNISKRYPEAVEYYKTACENNKSAFTSMIDSMYYNHDDLQHSDLVYMEWDDCGKVTQYAKGFASDAYKTMLKDAWAIHISEQEAIAIAYVYLEKQENDARGTNMTIYHVAFSQDVFNNIVDTAVMTSSTSFEKQPCDPPVCATETKEVDNPAYAEALEQFNHAVELWNSWGDYVRDACEAYADKLDEYNHTTFYVDAQKIAMENALNALYETLCDAVNNWYLLYGSRSWTIDENVLSYGYGVLGDEYDEAESILNSTPKKVEMTVKTCNHLHKYWSYGLFSSEALETMYSLGFTEQYIQWVSMCQHGVSEYDMPDVNVDV